MDIQHIASNADAAAIEADAGQALPDLRQALTLAKLGIAGRTTTHEQLLVQRAREKSTLTQTEFYQELK